MIPPPFCEGIGWWLVGIHCQPYRAVDVLQKKNVSRNRVAQFIFFNRIYEDESTENEHFLYKFVNIKCSFEINMEHGIDRWNFSSVAELESTGAVVYRRVHALMKI